MYHHNDLERELAMEEPVKDALGAYSIWAILEGGPESLPEASRLQVVSPFDDKVKIMHYGGYEHFERTDLLFEGSSSPQIIYRWTARTQIAE
jgi:Family of unknown function (DUF5988)